MKRATLVRRDAMFHANCGPVTMALVMAVCRCAERCQRLLWLGDWQNSLAPLNCARSQREQLPTIHLSSRSPAKGYINPNASCAQLADVPKAPLLPTRMQEGQGGLRNVGAVEAGVKIDFCAFLSERRIRSQCKYCLMSSFWIYLYTQHPTMGLSMISWTASGRNV